MTFTANKGFTFESTKTYTHSVGLSCCFRQWRANEHHCELLHGYALEVKLTFQDSKLDERNWVQDFGGLKQAKSWLEGTFDHKCVIAEDDPKLPLLQAMESAGIVKLVTLPHVGMEMFAFYIYSYLHDCLHLTNLVAVEVREHEGNSATYRKV